MTDLPGPLTTRPEIGAYYHGITFMHPDMVALLVWEDDVHDHRTFDRQLAFPETDAGRAAAEAKARRMLAVDDAWRVLQRIADAPAWGYPDKWETTPAQVRQLARAAITALGGAK